MDDDDPISFTINLCVGLLALTIEVGVWLFVLAGMALVGLLELFLPDD